MRGLVGNDLAALLEIALQHRHRGRDQRVDQHAEGEQPDNPGRVRFVHQGGERRRAEEAADVDQRTGQHGDRHHRRGDLLGIAGPAHDGEADPELVEAQHRGQHHRRDGERAEVGGPDQVGDVDAERERAEPPDDVVREAQAEGPTGPAGECPRLPTGAGKGVGVGVVQRAPPMPRPDLQPTPDAVLPGRGRPGRTGAAIEAATNTTSTQ